MDSGRAAAVSRAGDRAVRLEAGSHDSPSLRSSATGARRIIYGYVVPESGYSFRPLGPYVRSGGDCKGPGAGGRPASESVYVCPTENGDLLVNVYQSVDNGSGALNEFGDPRVVIRYGRADVNGQPVEGSDEIVVHVGNSGDSYWATVAHIDV